MDREKGISILSSVLKNTQNIDCLEKYIYEYAKLHSKSSDLENIYNQLLHDCIYLLKSTTTKKSETMKILLVQISENKVCWNSPWFEEYRKQIEEEDKFMTTPFEIEEGVLECKCGSKRTISFQKQTRSADEGSTTFAQCVECGAKWKHNN